MIATVLAYVRTADGVVELGEGDLVPDDADQEHVAELEAAGVLTTGSTPPAAPPAVETAPPTPAAAAGDKPTPPAPAAGSRERRRW